MKAVILAAIALLSGCTLSPQSHVDYRQVDTAYSTELLSPPVPVSNEGLPEGTYYHDESAAYVAELDAYIDYLKRHRVAIAPLPVPKVVTPPQAAGVSCTKEFTPPQRPPLPVISKVSDIRDDREVILAMKYYILDLKKHIIDYDAAAAKAYQDWLKTCVR